MATSATNIYAAQWNNGNHYPAGADEWRAIASYNITTTAGWGYNNGQNWVTGIRFTLAQPATSITFSVCTRGYTSGSRVLNYKIVAGTDDSSYHNATSATAADGTVTMSATDYARNTFTVNKSYAAGTYVLFLWTSMAAGTYNYAQLYCAAASGSGSYAMTITYEAASTYTLTRTQGTGTSLTVQVTAGGLRPSYPVTITGSATVYGGETVKVTYSATTGYGSATAKYGSTAISSGGTFTVAGSVTVQSSASVLSYTLAISAGTGSTVTVTRTSSPKQGASTGTLSNGAKVYYSDTLQVTFGASTGYDLGTHTVNGSTFTSGGTHTVTGAVSVVATATLKTYTLTISQGSNSTITVKRGSTTLSNGATITYGDVLAITFAAAPGYTLGTNTVKVGSTTSTGSGSYTVTGAVTATSTATQTSFTLTISQGSNSTITVKRGSTTLPNGATITYGDVLTITFGVSSGYTLTTATVNGQSFTSGSTYTVTSAVTVVSQATANPYTLTINAGTNTTVTVMRGTQQLYNGAQIATNDVLTISFEAASGYAISIHTVNGSTFTSGNTLTVTGAVTIVTSAVTVGQLAEPTNITPDVLNGTGCVDVTQGIAASWQVNGNVSMTAYQIAIYENNAASTEVYTTGKITLSTPFWGHDYEGNVQYFSATISASALSAAGVVNGNEYKLLITEWWGDDAYITQNTPSVFVTRSAASVAVTFGGATGTTETFLGEYTQANGAPLNWVRWTIYQGTAAGTAVYDSGRIAGTGVLRVDWDGMMPEVTYTVVCELETADGDLASGSLSYTVETGTQYVFSGDVTVCQKSDCGIVVSWTPQPFAESYTIHRGVQGESVFAKVAEVNSITASLTDYGAAAQTPYIYYVFPIIGGEAQQPGISEVFTADFRTWSILRTSQIDKKSFAISKRYAFRMGFGGVSEGGISNNNSPSLLQNFTRYPLRQTASSNYLSGSVSGFVGSVGQSGTYSDTVSQAREIMELAQTTDPLFLTDTKGHFLRIQTSGSIGVTVQTKSRVQPQTLTLPWAEIGDANGISVLNNDELLAASAALSVLTDPDGVVTEKIPVQTGRVIRATFKTNGTYGEGMNNEAYLIYYRSSGEQIGDPVVVSGDLTTGITILSEVPATAGSVSFGWYLGTDTTTSVVDAAYM